VTIWVVESLAAPPCPGPVTVQSIDAKSINPVHRFHAVIDIMHTENRTTDASS